MGGFANLKKAFDAVMPDDINDWTMQEEQLRHLELLCLFEIAGNLDTIAFEMRKINQREAERFMLTKEAFLKENGETL